MSGPTPVYAPLKPGETVWYDGWRWNVVYQEGDYLRIRRLRSPDRVVFRRQVITDDEKIAEHRAHRARLKRTLRALKKAHRAP